MQPPSQLLSHSWTFAKALRLPERQLRRQLALLQQLVPDRAEAQRLAAQHTGILVSSSGGQLLARAGRVAAAFQLPQVRPATRAAARLLLQLLLLLHKPPVLAAAG